MILALALTLCLLAAALLVLLVAFARISHNVGTLDLEDYAHRHHVIFIPVSTQMVDELRVWSKPVRLRLDNHRHPLLAELIVTSDLKDKE